MPYAPSVPAPFAEPPTGRSKHCRRSTAENLQKARTLDVAAGEHHRHVLGRHSAALLQQRGQWGGARAFDDLMSVVVVDAHRLGDLVLTDLHDARGATANIGYGLRMGFASRQPVGEGSRERRVGGSPRGKG